MKLVKPAYFDSFRCIAGACPDSCCKEWDVQVDEAAAACYRALPGPLGQRLRQSLTEENGTVFMAVADGRCPMWRRDGLCEIQAQLGHGALCRTCREFPRLTHDYGDYLEYGLELSCPEAARLILENPSPAFVAAEQPGGETPEYDRKAMALLLRTREAARAILADSVRPVHERIALLLLYGFQVQEALDGGDELAFDPACAIETARSMAISGGADAMLDFFLGLEMLSPAWAERLRSPTPAPWSEQHAALARYFVDRYWLQAVSDYDLVCRVKLGVISCVVIRTLGGNLLDTAVRYAKEIENDIDNVDAILDGAYSSPALTDAALLGQLFL